MAADTYTHGKLVDVYSTDGRELTLRVRHMDRQHETLFVVQVDRCTAKMKISAKAAKPAKKGKPDGR